MNDQIVKDLTLLLLNLTRRAKSVTLTEAGCERALALAARYLEEAAEVEKSDT